MEKYWGYIAIIGSVLTFLTLAPYLFGMFGILTNMSMETASVAMVDRMVRLLAGAVVALIPISIGGVFLFALFEFAEAQA